MRNPIYQVDAFTEVLFGGNPAAVVPLQSWPDDALLQAIAAENNLSETAFFVGGAGRYRLRWFTPTDEVDLCGHATLATAHVLFEHRGFDGEVLRFDTRSGELRVRRSPGGMTMDFPAARMVDTTPDSAVCAALGAEAEAAAIAAENPWQVLYAFSEEAQVAALAPDFRALAAASPFAVIVTAPGDHADFVSRFFGPQVGVDEDPVTGSAHCSLVPYWAQRLGRNTLRARQISARGGELVCELRGERVMMTGRAITFLQGEFCMPG